MDFEDNLDEELQIDEQLQNDKPYKIEFDQLLLQHNEFIHRMNFNHQIIDFPSFPNQTLYINQISYDKQIGIFDLINTQNSIFDKVAQVFVVLDDEVNKIQDQFENKFYDILIMYGEQKQHNKEVIGQQFQKHIFLLFSQNLYLIKQNYKQKGDSENLISQHLIYFNQIYQNIKHLNHLIFNIVNQLNNGCNKDALKIQTFLQNQDFTMLIDTLGKALSILYQIDVIVNENKNIKNHWSNYKRMLKVIKSDISNYDVSLNQIKKLERVVAVFDKTLMSGKCFLLIAQQKFDVARPDICNLVHSNIVLNKVYQDYFKTNLKTFNEILGTNLETNERQKLICVLCNFVIFNQLFRQEDRKLWKNLWSLQKKCLVIQLKSYILIYVSKFLLECTPLQNPSNSRDPKDHNLFIKNFLDQQDKQLEQKVINIYQNFITWSIRIQSNIADNINLTERENKQDLSNQKIQMRAKLIMTGFLLANQIQNLFKVNCLLHINEKIGLNQQQAKNYILCILMLKQIQNIFHQKQFNTQIIYRVISNQIYKIVIPYFQKLKSKQITKQKDQYQDAYDNIQLFFNILLQSNSQIKFSILNFCQYWLKLAGLNQNERDDIKYLLWKAEIICNHQYYINKVYLLQYFFNNIQNYKQINQQLNFKLTDTQFLYYVKELQPIFFDYFIQEPQQTKSLPYLIQALNDPIPSLLLTNSETIQTYQDQIYNNFFKYLIKPLSIQIEDFLRISVQSSLINDLQPLNLQKIKDYNQLLNLRPIKLFDKIFDLKYQIQKQLNQNFYNLNAINMHDQEIYQIIRQLAYNKFNLELAESYIPSQTMEQGQIDVLQVLRNIQKFVVNFCYNLYLQTFIEVSIDKKQLLTVGIKQISDGINTHGHGTLNTTVNSIYQFICKKFNILTQFLYDDHIKSPLIRENKFMKKQKQRKDQQYCYQRAETLLKEIKQLGKFEDGSTYLDKFRLLIKQVGNSLGFVRILRSASLNVCSRKIEPVYASELINFLDEVQQCGFEQTTVDCAQNLNQIIEKLQNNFTQKTDYLKLIVNNLTEKLDLDHDHLENLYVFIPALSINHVEHMNISKEKLQKINSQDVYLVDDGFALGLAFFLKLLKQDHLYDSLNWEKEVQQHFSKEVQKQENENQGKNNKKDEFDTQKQLSMRKLQLIQQEFQILSYSLEASRILFKEY